MITVIHNGNGPTWTVDYEDGMTVASMVQNIIDQYGLEIRGGWTLLDTHDSGRLPTTDEDVVDGRLYVLNAWIIRVRQPAR